MHTHSHTLCANNHSCALDKIKHAKNLKYIYIYKYILHEYNYVYCKEVKIRNTTNTVGWSKDLIQNKEIVGKKD